MQTSRSLRRVKVAVVVSVALLLSIALMIFIIQGRASAERMTIIGRLAQAELIITNYEYTHGRLPPAFTQSANGDRMHSWRMIALLGQPADHPRPTGVRTDEPWNSPANKKAAHTNRHYAGYFNLTWSDDVPISQILAVTGPNSLWESDSGLSRSSTTARPDTVMLVFVPESEIHWMEPRDIEESDLHRLLDEGRTILCISASGQYGPLGNREGVLYVVPAHY